MNLTDIQRQQEEEYIIPYHYLISHDRLLSFPARLIACPHYINYLRIIQTELAPFRGQRILDIGCGDGRFCYYLKSENAVIYGVDYSERAVAFATIMNPQANFQLGDLTGRLPFDDTSFDQIVLVDTLEHIQPHLIPHAMKEIHRVLNYEGQLIIAVPHRNRKLDSKHYQHFTAQHLCSLLSSLFKIVSLRGFHNNSLFPNLIFHLLIAIYYYLYPLKELGFGRGVQVISHIGYLFFEKLLRDCEPDDGLALICKAIKVYPLPK